MMLEFDQQKENDGLSLFQLAQMQKEQDADGVEAGPEVAENEN